MPDPERWLLTRSERDNPYTQIDDRYDGDRAWSTGNQVDPLIDGATYFAALHEALEATGDGDLVLFTDWQGDAGQQLTDDPDSRVLDVLAAARQRGVDVRGLVWRSHTDQAGFFHEQNRHLGEQLRKRGIPVILDMRVRPRGSHHQKFVVIRHPDRPDADLAFVGGIDLAHNRRDDHDHAGDPQGRRTVPEYGEHAPWHDVQVRLQGPIVHDIETVFRERWEDQTPPTSLPWRKVRDTISRVDTTPVPLAPQLPPPPEAGTHTVQLLRTYPERPRRPYPFAPRGERSVAAGYRKAIGNATELVYVEDQYFWGHDVADIFAEQLRAQQDLRLITIIPLYPDVEGLNRSAQHLARDQALDLLMRVAPGRVAAYGLENPAGVPVYVHAKVAVIDDRWAATGSDNFNRRSWTHDSELTAAVLDDTYARDLRLRLAAEHLDRLDDVLGGSELKTVMADCLSSHAMFDKYGEYADALDAWYRDGRRGPRPPGRLRRLPATRDRARTMPIAAALLNRVHNPDGRPRDERGGA
ncbi:phosphatidylserine/phosphatidylglycerophosphate/cardiolipin synthase-like enzyme [Mumia flava]|uniref:Phosphatidylserine/phosphatidylglycerophosphate/ cardiolipin synthase-like enzyme n=1 Tax=Mumia flava TaxID=1348852 RepID=A0A0B2BH21_9ACTN|nr:phospholipase D family protein [Mumia flava]PJJ54273.1 phosphatidylserine/phosphatidylglycerophosphate/cardiolipin synthase-like enzyme [Mumia flava]